MSKLSTEERLNILEGLVQLRTVNDNEIEACRYLQNVLKEHGIDSQIDEIDGNHANLIAEVGEGKPVVGISGHMDVVDEGDHEHWTYPPFELTESDGYLYGRGTADMKSGLAGLVIAMIELHEKGLKSGTIKLLATAREELDQLGAEHMYNRGHMKDVDALIIAEPSEQMIVYAHKGALNCRVHSKGVAFHSSVPALGQNAITPLLQFVQQINQAYLKLLQEVEGNQLDFSNFIAAARHMVPEDADEAQLSKLIHSPVITNTIIRGGEQINSVPDKASADFNVRTIPEYDNEKVKALFSETISAMNQQGAQLSHEVLTDFPPVLTTGENSLVQLGKRVAEDIFQKPIVVAPTVGATDASNLLRDKPANFAFLMMGPGENPHAVDERVKKDVYLGFIDFYEALISQYIEAESK